MDLNKALCNMPMGAVKFLFAATNFIYFPSPPSIEIIMVETPKLLNEGKKRILLIGDEVYCMLFALFCYKKNQSLSFLYCYDIYEMDRMQYTNPFFKVSLETLNSFLINETEDIKDFKKTRNSCNVTVDHCVISEVFLKSVTADIIRKHKIMYEPVDLNVNLFDYYDGQNIDSIHVLLNPKRIYGDLLPSFSSHIKELSRCIPQSRYALDFIIPKKIAVSPFTHEELSTIHSNFKEEFSVRELISNDSYILRIFIHPKNKVVCEKLAKFTENRSGRIDLLITQFDSAIIQYLKYVFRFKNEYVNLRNSSAESSFIIKDCFPSIILYHYATFVNETNEKEDYEFRSIVSERKPIHFLFHREEDNTRNAFDLNSLPDLYAKFI